MSADGVGAAIAAALLRCEELRAERPGVRVRIHTLFGDGEGLAIVARFAARYPAQSDAQYGKGVRQIPWADLDRRSPELVGLVEEAAREVEEAVASAPPPPPRSDNDAREGEGYEALCDKFGETFGAMARQLFEADYGTRMLTKADVLECVAQGAVRVAAVAAFGCGMPSDDLKALGASELGRFATAYAGGERPFWMPLQ